MKKTKSVTFRQGDVFMKKIDALPDHLVPVSRENGRVVLAKGETTGHMHAIADKHVAHFRMNTEFVSKMDESLRKQFPANFLEPGTTFLRVESPVKVEHEEHGPVTLPPGDYVIPQAREYYRGEFRRLND